MVGAALDLVGLAGGGEAGLILTGFARIGGETFTLTRGDADGQVGGRGMGFAIVDAGFEVAVSGAIALEPGEGDAVGCFIAEAETISEGVCWFTSEISTGNVVFTDDFVLNSIDVGE